MNRKCMLVGSQAKTIYLVGAGGTGSYVAQGLAKMISGYKLKHSVIIIDPDVVEEKNCSRQNFWHYEIGQPKAYALALRLNQQYGIDFAHIQGVGEQKRYKITGKAADLIFHRDQD